MGGVRQTIELEGGLNLSEEEWATELTRRMEALEEMRGRLLRPQGMTFDQEEQLAALYQGVESEARELEAYGRQQRWI